MRNPRMSSCDKCRSIGRKGELRGYWHDAGAQVLWFCRACDPWAEAQWSMEYEETETDEPEAEQAEFSARPEDPAKEQDGNATDARRIPSLVQR